MSMQDAQANARVSALLDVLSTRLADQSADWQRQLLPLDFTGSGALAAMMQGAAGGPAASLATCLAACLALVECRLTGADRVLATTLNNGVVRQCAVRVPEVGTWGSWQAELAMALSEADGNGRRPLVRLEGAAVLSLNRRPSHE